MKCTDDILLFIPQRYPFVMIDKLLSADEVNATGTFLIKAENILCEEGFFSEAGLLENIAQTVAATRGYKQQKENNPVAGGYIAGVRNFEVFSLPAINDVLITQITVTGKMFNMTAISGRVLLNDTLVAQCEMKIFSHTRE
ncbi:MAG: 3-hydroxyacyl-ACP dehydratase [Parafilimonas sp.]